jgi:cytochrome c oxidase subunit 3
MTDAALDVRPAFAEDPQAGALGLWVFLASEVLFFGGLFVAYLYGRTHFPTGWAVASRHTDVVLGTVNTALLLTSSAVVAFAALCARHPPRRGLVARLLVATAMLGFAFLVLKGVEWHDEWREGLVPGPTFALAAVAGAQAFYVLYFVMTGLHGVHMIAGIGVLLALARESRPARAGIDERQVEVAALYWHFVDIVWIFLYPLIYLVNRHA